MGSIIFNQGPRKGLPTSRTLYASKAFGNGSSTQVGCLFNVCNLPNVQVKTTFCITYVTLTYSKLIVYSRREQGDKVGDKYHSLGGPYDITLIKIEDIQLIPSKVCRNLCMCKSFVS